MYKASVHVSISTSVFPIFRVEFSFQVTFIMPSDSTQLARGLLSKRQEKTPIRTEDHQNYVERSPAFQRPIKTIRVVAHNLEQPNARTEIIGENYITQRIECSSSCFIKLQMEIVTDIEDYHMSYDGELLYRVHDRAETKNEANSVALSVLDKSLTTNKLLNIYRESELHKYQFCERDLETAQSWAVGYRYWK